MTPARKGRSWWVGFDGRDGLRTEIRVEGKAGAAEVIIAFRAALREAMQSGGCRAFTVAVHCDGPECDHELP